MDVPLKYSVWEYEGISKIYTQPTYFLNDFAYMKRTNTNKRPNTHVPFFLLHSVRWNSPDLKIEILEHDD